MQLQIQSVIYGNEKESLMKAIKALKQAVMVYHRKIGELSASLIYGDSSPTPILDNADVLAIKEELGKVMGFQYRVFGFNSGTAKGHNLMAQNTDADVLMIMNPDVILEPNCLCRLLQPFQQEDVGMVEARQTPLEHAKEYNKKTGETEWASTACTVFKTDIYQKINGFDAETFFLYCDDLDFSWRVRLAGYKIIYMPSAIVYHAKTLSLTGTWQPTSAEIYYSAEAAMLLAYKWSNPERAEKLCKMYLQHGGESEKKAAHEFERRKKAGTLPEMIDPDHKIGKFLGDEYCEMRFKFKR